MYQTCTANENTNTRSAASAYDFSCAFFNTNALLVHIALAVCFFVVSVVVLPVSIISILDVISVIIVVNVIIIAIVISLVVLVIRKWIQKHKQIPIPSKR